MKTKYFEFSKNGGSEKYSEFTEAEYLKAKEEENRWFISFGDSVLECGEAALGHSGIYAPDPCADHAGEGNIRLRIYPYQ